MLPCLGRQVKDVHIIKHKDTNKPRGCFVEFTSCADLEKALLKDGTVRPFSLQLGFQTNLLHFCNRHCPAGSEIGHVPPWQMVMGRPIRVDVAEDRSDRSRSGGAGCRHTVHHCHCAMLPCELKPPAKRH